MHFSKCSKLLMKKNDSKLLIFYGFVATGNFNPRNLKKYQPICSSYAFFFVDAVTRELRKKNQGTDDGYAEKRVTSRSGQKTRAGLQYVVESQRKRSNAVILRFSACVLHSCQRDNLQKIKDQCVQRIFDYSNIVQLQIVHCSKPIVRTI